MYSGTSAGVSFILISGNVDFSLESVPSLGITSIPLSTRNCNADKNSSSDTSPFIQYPAVSFIQLGIFSPSASAKLTKSPIVKIRNIDET